MLASLIAGLLLLSRSSQAQTTTPNVKTDVLGTGDSALLLSPITDPDNNGLDALGGGTDPSWNWEEITGNDEPDFEGGEYAFNIFDHKVDGGGNAKWCCDDPTVDNPLWVAVKFHEQVSITYFTATSGNDSPDRDPINWAIQGSNDGTTYTDIYHYNEAAAIWTERLQVIKFTLPTPSPAYRYIRYIAYDTPGTMHQISEIEYFGIFGGATVIDTDKDGMPDDWEKQYGLNPNDPSDAAKDANGNGISNLDEYKLGLNPLDTTKPVITAASTVSTFDTVKLTFSKDLDPATATNLANYTISPSLAVTAASYKSKAVTLTTAKQAPGATAYTVTVNNVKDINNWKVATDSKITFYSYLMTKTGVLKFSYWSGIDGTPVQNLLDDPRYPASPTLTGAVYSFNSRDFFPDDTHDTYGATMEGYLTPTESAKYRFFVYSDDASQLYLSTDATEANLAMIAEETGCCNNFTEPDSPRTSEPISLVAGTKYFVRMIYKEGGGGDYGQVAWRKEGDTTAAASLTPIPGKYLSALVDVPYPSEGLFKTQSPAANAKGIRPDTSVTIVHIDGKTAWTADNVSMKFNGAAVKPTFTKDLTVATIVYKPSALLPSLSDNTITLSYVDAGGQPATLEWTFTTTAYSGPVKDSVKSYPGLLMGKAVLTGDAGGHTAKAGDLAVDFGKAGGAWVDIMDASFLNEATKNDEMSFACWVKKYDIANGSAFWANSASAGRGFQAHTPWSDDSIYFDTMGCCDASTQRINAAITDFADYAAVGDDSFWTNKWHHFVFTKKADQKNIFIDGKLFLNGSSSAPLKADFTELALGTDGLPGGDFMHGLIDDFAVYATALAIADAAKLAGGTSPKDLSSAKLLAYWDFNSVAVAVAPTLSAARTATGLSITFTGTLQSADAITGTFTDVAGAASPYAVTSAAGQKYFRAKN